MAGHKKRFKSGETTSTMKIKMKCIHLLYNNGLLKFYSLNQSRKNTFAEEYHETKIKDARLKFSFQW